ncbi:MAG: hypothetical protein JST54_18970 [Deltaproteobacteria bacterium]|nr:hypothetical protein [Deltaproteobacteria bacterium]
MSVPLELERQVAAEEALATLRHDLRNKLAAIRNAAFFLLQKSTVAPGSDPRVETFLKLIDKEVLAAEARLLADTPFSGLREHAVGPVRLEAVLREAGVPVVAIGTREVSADAGEAAALIHWLQELVRGLSPAATLEANVRDTNDGATLELRATPCPPVDPSSPPPGMPGAALRLARRIARRHGAELSARAEGEGVVLSVAFAGAAP